MPQTPQWRPAADAALIAPGVARFPGPHDHRRPLAPSHSLVAELPAAGPLEASGATRPLFARDDLVRHIRIDIEAGASLYGTGEVAGPLERSGRQTVCWNTV